MPFVSRKEKLKISDEEKKMLEECTRSRMKKKARVDLPRKGKPAEIGMDARSWFLSVACMKPKGLVFASELWTTNALVQYTREHCEGAEHRCLKNLWEHNSNMRDKS